MAEEGKRPIIVVKKKKAAGGHHGGAWKVAYADFVTAMMAFFLVMWLVASVSKEQRAALFEYFKNPSMEPGKSVKPAPGQNGPGGASTSPINLGGGLDAPKSSTSQEQGLGQPTSLEAAKKLAEAEEKKQLDTLMKELVEAIEKSPNLQQFKNQLLLDLTPEGLRIQIVDQQNRAMFDSGSSQLKDYTVRILAELAKHLNTVPNRLSLSGHTDAKPYAGTGKGYTNWELSADRANAARRTLLDGGLSEGKVARVVGLASSVLFVRNEPLNPINRRISIIVMTKKAEDAALSTDAPKPPEGEAEGAAPPTAAAPPAPASAGPAAAKAAGTAAASTGAAAAGAAASAAAASGTPTNIKPPIAPPINLPLGPKP